MTATTPAEAAMIDGYNEAMSGSEQAEADRQIALADEQFPPTSPLFGISSRAMEVFEADYKISSHRRPKCSKADFAAGWRTAMELHGGIIWKTLNRDRS